MEKCFRCGIKENKAILLRAVSRIGFVYVCQKCFMKDKLPLFDEKPFEREVLIVSPQSGLLKHDTDSFEKMKTIQYMGEEINLEELARKNFQKKMTPGGEAVDLTPNFHWIVMRKRRMMKMTQRQLAEKIFVPVSTIEFLEKGSLPQDYIPLIRKIENTLGVSILKESKRYFAPRNLADEVKVSSGLTIKDLRELHKRESSKRE